MPVYPRYPVRMMSWESTHAVVRLASREHHFAREERTPLAGGGVVSSPFGSQLNFGPPKTQGIVRLAFDFDVHGL